MEQGQKFNTSEQIIEGLFYRPNTLVSLNRMLFVKIKNESNKGRKICSKNQISAFAKCVKMTYAFHVHNRGINEKRRIFIPKIMDKVSKYAPKNLWQNFYGSFMAFGLL